MFKFLLGVGVGVFAANRLNSIAEDQLSRSDSILTRSTVKLAVAAFTKLEKLGIYVSFDNQENSQ